jgi:thioredoxin 1
MGSGITLGPGEGNRLPEAIRVLEGEDEFRSFALQSEVPVLVAFSAVWCAPCTWLEPYLVEIQRHDEVRVRIAKVDVDRDPALAIRYGVTSVPTVVHMRHGKEVGRSLGIEPDRLRAMALGKTSPGSDASEG